MEIDLSYRYAWDEAPGAAAYNVRVKDATQAPLNPPGTLQAVDPFINVSEFLFVGGTMAPAGDYVFEVASVGPGGAPQSAWREDVVTFVGLGPPGNTRFEPIP